MARLFINDHLSRGSMRGISDDRSVFALFESITRYAPLDVAALA